MTPFDRRSGWLLLVALVIPWDIAGAQTPAETPAVTSPAESPEEPKLPQLKDIPLPTADELLHGKPTDWIVLLEQTVLIVEPVSPRPNTVEILKQKYEELLKVPTTEIPLDEKLEQLAALQRLPITLIGEEVDPEFTLEIRYIAEIIYFETQIVRRVTQLLNAGDLTSAYELLMFLDRRHRNWPGFDDLYQRFLFLEAAQLLEDGSSERAWISAARLFGLKFDYPDLSQLMGRIADDLIGDAVIQTDYRQARFHLARLQNLLPEHSIVEKWTQDLTSRARDTLSAAAAASTQGDLRAAALSADLAARIWPSLPGLREAHRLHNDRHQILKVGLLREAPPSKSYPFSTPARDRQQSLCSLPLFEEDRIEDGRVRYRSRWIESWDPRDLGREIHFRLQDRRAPWESRPVLVSGQVLATLAARADPDSPLFDSRWQREMTELKIVSPTEWVLSLSRIPLRIESRLRIAIPRSTESIDWSRDLAVSPLEFPDCQRFYPLEATPERVVFQRTRPQPPSAEGRHIAEIVEQTYPSWERLLQSLMRGEIDFIPAAEWVDVPGLSADDRFFVHPSALPRTDLIQIHPDSILATNSSLRRALLHSLDRQRLLHEQVLHCDFPTAGRLVTGPFATSLSAYDPQLRQPDFDPIRAAALVATVRRQFEGELPTLKLTTPGDHVTARVVPELIEMWRHVGLTVEWQGADDESRWDLAYRPLRLAEPVDDLWSLLHPDGQTDWQNLDFYPHWLRARLWELEQTVDGVTALRLLREIQREFLTEARWIPLWEVDEFVVARRRMTGLRTRPMHPYQDIERWTLQSWYPTETP